MLLKNCLKFVKANREFSLIILSLIIVSLVITFALNSSSLRQAPRSNNYEVILQDVQEAKSKAQQNPEAITPQGDLLLKSARDGEYYIVYEKNVDGFLIFISKGPFEQMRAIAEQDFVNNILRANEGVACTLKVKVRTHALVNKQLADKDLPLSFCGAIQVHIEGIPQEPSVIYDEIGKPRIPVDDQQKIAEVLGRGSKINRFDTLLFESSDYRIVHVYASDTFSVSITSPNFESVRQQVENKLLNLLGVKKETMCKLAVQIAPSDSSEKTFPLSFCAQS